MKHKNNIYDIKELGFVPPKYGGVSVSIARLIEKLTGDGFVVGGFYSSENTNPNILGSPLFEQELNLSTKRLFSELPHCLKVLRPYKVLHSHYSLEHMVYLWCFLFLLQKKIVVTVHNSMVQRFYNDCDSLNRFFLKRVAHHPNVTWVAVSEQTKEEMLKLPVKFKQPIHVIPAYIPDVKEVNGSLPATFQQYIVRHKKIIVFYGHSFMLHEGNDVYGFKDALDLYSKISNNDANSMVGFILCISDDKDVEKIEKLHHEAMSLGVEDKIHWQIGPIENMKALWEKTDVYIRPTCTDGDSVAVREALDMGVQVVASNVCMRPNRTLVYEYGNMDDFINKVTTALKSCHAESEPDFDNYNRLKSIYNDLLKK